MSKVVLRMLALVVLCSMAACASVKPGHDAAGRYDPGTSAGGGE